MSLRLLTAVVLVLSAGLTACSSGEGGADNEPIAAVGSTAADSDVADPSPASTAATAGTAQDERSSAEPQAISAEAIADVVCTEPATRMGPEAEVLTDESWTCSRSGDQVRIDLYANGAQMGEAQEMLRDFYESAGDTRSLADLPFVCGDGWTVGFDFLETRDSAISELVAAGFSAGTC
jgi:hypothetical protein